MDELMECPNPECPPHIIAPRISSDYSEYINYRRYRVSCGCGTSGPWRENEKAAIAAWNALPRTPRWVEYDGTEGTLPPIRTWLCIHNNEYGTRFAAQHRQNGKCVDPGNHVYRLQECDRWMPWPEAKGGE